MPHTTLLSRTYLPQTSRRIVRAERFTAPTCAPVAAVDHRRRTCVTSPPPPTVGVASTENCPSSEMPPLTAVMNLSPHSAAVRTSPPVGGVPVTITAYKA